MLSFFIHPLGDASKNRNAHQRTSSPTAPDANRWESERSSSLAYNAKLVHEVWCLHEVFFVDTVETIVSRACAPGLCLTQRVWDFFHMRESVGVDMCLAFLSEKHFGWTNLWPSDSSVLFQNENKLASPAPPLAQINMVPISQDTFQKLQGARKGSDIPPCGL